jgi:hypothetical protein
LGLFGNDDAKYGQDGVSHIETNKISAKKETLQFKRDQRLHGKTLTGFVAQTARRGVANATLVSFFFWGALTMRMIYYYIDNPSMPEHRLQLRLVSAHAEAHRRNMRMFRR